MLCPKHTVSGIALISFLNSFGVEQKKLGIITEKAVNGIAVNGIKERTLNYMRTFKKGILSLLLAALMLTLAACGQNKQDYEKLKTDIVGIWCDINGPEYFENDGDPYYQIYEFTSGGMLAYHIITPNIASYYDFSYELRDNFLDIDGQMCKVSIENDILTMTNDSGDTKYRRMSMEEVCNFGVVYLDSDNYYKQLEYTDFFKTNWPDASAAAAETGAAETDISAETDAETNTETEDIAS